MTSRTILLTVFVSMTAVISTRADEPRNGAVPKPADEAARKQYPAMKEKTAPTANAQWKLAVWCEEHGLKAEALDHFAAVTRLDPKRDAAWKRLGYKKVEGRWLNAEQIAARAEAKAAVRRWGQTLAAIHRQIHGGPRQAEAEAALSGVADERAIPAIYLEFGRGGPDQAIAVQLLGQIRGPVSSRTLAYLSVYGATADVRSRATETLRGRAATEYVEDLIALIVDPLKYEVRPVGGPNSPGVLFVEGEQFNVRRFYMAPGPDVGFMPGDMIGFDTDGSPAILKPGKLIESHAVKGPNPVIMSTREHTLYSLRDMAAEARRSAIAAQSQLEGDIQQIEALNAARISFSRIVMDVLKDATGKDAGKDKQSWKAWLADLKGYAKEPVRAKPTFDQVMPVAYVPVAFGKLGFLQLAIPDN